MKATAARRGSGARSGTVAEPRARSGAANASKPPLPSQAVRRRPVRVWGQGDERSAPPATTNQKATERAPAAAAPTLQLTARDYDLSTGFAPEYSIYDTQITKHALANGQSPRLVKCMMAAESTFQRRAKSPKGAVGLMQVTKIAQKEVDDTGRISRTSVDGSLLLGTRYMKYCEEELGLRRVDLKVAAYNAGGTTVKQLGRVPQNGQTPAYVKKVLALYRNNATMENGELEWRKPTKKA